MQLTTGNFGEVGILVETLAQVRLDVYEVMQPMQRWSRLFHQVQIRREGWVRVRVVGEILCRPTDGERREERPGMIEQLAGAVHGVFEPTPQFSGRRRNERRVLVHDAVAVSAVDEPPADLLVIRRAQPADSLDATPPANLLGEIEDRRLRVRKEVLERGERIERELLEQSKPRYQRYVDLTACDSEEADPGLHDGTSSPVSAEPPRNGREPVSRRVARRDGRDQAIDIAGASDLGQTVNDGAEGLLVWLCAKELEQCRGRRDRLLPRALPAKDRVGDTSSEAELARLPRRLVRKRIAFVGQRAAPVLRQQGARVVEQRDARGSLEGLQDPFAIRFPQPPHRVRPIAVRVSGRGRAGEPPSHARSSRPSPGSPAAGAPNKIG